MSSLQLVGTSSAYKPRRASLATARSSRTLNAEFSSVGKLAGRTKAQLLGAFLNTGVSRQKLCFSVSAPATLP